MVVNYDSEYYPTEDIASLYRLRDMYKHQLEYEESATKSKVLSTKIIALHESITKLRRQHESKNSN